jgi:transaldolase / glucose-6-phosphate isomerase
MNPLYELRDAGQSVWYDNIRRAMLESGEMARYLRDYAVTGITSNPTIFERAIAGSGDYDDAIAAALDAGRADDAEELFFRLAVDDIRWAADLLAPHHHETGGVDGFVSLEVSPRLADDAAGTIDSARRLYRAVGRPNVMIKVPATTAGLTALERLVADGIPVNVTLIFSLSQYRAVAEAYLRGVERRLASGADPSVRSVASVFVSRWDGAVDPQLPENQHGKVGIAQARLIYAGYSELLASERWMRLAAAGAAPQRVLWASTGVKNPTLPDTLYVQALAAPDTVNTMPESTLFAFAEHGQVGRLLTADPGDASDVLAMVETAGIDLGALAGDLQARGLDAFGESFDRLLETIHTKADALRGRRGLVHSRLGPVAERVEDAFHNLVDREAALRLWKKDHTLWQHDPTEVADRLGWLDAPSDVDEKVAELDRFVEDVRARGITHAVVLGMGGSSLFPEVLARVWGPQEGAIELRVLDTTDPAAIRRVAHEVPLEQTLFVASSKSGATLETRSHLDYFWERLGRTPDRFVAVTDPGTELHALARDRKFRRTWLADPSVGGRYSALSWFGLVPAGLLGIDAAELLHRAGRLCAATAACVPAPENPSLQLAAALAGAATAGRDKLTIVLPEWASTFGLWLEQLIAESLGKQGIGIVPIIGEPLGEPDVYFDDRLFVSFGPGGPTLDALASAGHPVIELPFEHPYDIGAEVFRWEAAVALAGAALGVNPFDQPNVAEAKEATNRVLAEGVPDVEITPTAELLAQVRAGDYLAIQAYLDPGSPDVAAIQDARMALRDRYRVATTTGLGPRFLHSTGQLHKGGPSTGVFLQIVGDDTEEIPIPGRPFGFSLLKQAQAAGDLATLRAHELRAGRVALADLVEEAQR